MLGFLDISLFSSDETTMPVIWLKSLVILSSFCRIRLFKSNWQRNLIISDFGLKSFKEYSLNYGKYQVTNGKKIKNHTHFNTSFIFLKRTNIKTNLKIVEIKKKDFTFILFICF